MYIELKGPKRISIPNFIQLFFWLFLRLPLGSQKLTSKGDLLKSASYYND